MTAKTSNEIEQTKNAPGRRPRTEIEAHRTRTWASVVIRRSGLSLRQLDALCEVKGSGQWARYQQGLSSPSPTRLAQVERHYPGTSRIYASPIWAGLDVVTLGRLHPLSFFFSLAEPLRSSYLREGWSRSGSPFWRESTTFAEDVATLRRLMQERTAPFDMLSLLLALTHEAVIAQKSQVFEYYVKGWLSLKTLLQTEVYKGGGDWNSLPEDLIAEFAEDLGEVAGDDLDLAPSDL